MNDSIALRACLAPYLSGTRLGHLSHLIFAMLCISGRVTTLGLSRWSEAGGSCRTLQGGYQPPFNWALLRWVVVRTPRLNPDGT